MNDTTAAPASGGGKVACLGPTRDQSSHKCLVHKTSFAPQSPRVGISPPSRLRAGGSCPNHLLVNQASGQQGRPCPHYLNANCTKAKSLKTTSDSCSSEGPVMGLEGTLCPAASCDHEPQPHPTLFSESLLGPGSVCQGRVVPGPYGALPLSEKAVSRLQGTCQCRGVLRWRCEWRRQVSAPSESSVQRQPQGQVGAVLARHSLGWVCPGWGGVSVCLGCPYKPLHQGGLETTGRRFSWFWRPHV